MIVKQIYASDFPNALAKLQQIFLFIVTTCNNEKSNKNRKSYFLFRFFNYWVSKTFLNALLL